MNEVLNILKNPQLIIPANGNHIYSKSSIDKAIAKLEAQEDNKVPYIANKGATAIYPQKTIWVNGFLYELKDT